MNERSCQGMYDFTLVSLKKNSHFYLTQGKEKSPLYRFSLFSIFNNSINVGANGSYGKCTFNVPF